MEVSLFIAKILGPCFIVVALGMMFNREFYQKVMEDYSKNAALVFFSGMFPLIFGIVVVLLHNVWIAKWPVIITIIGWCGIIKGIWLTVFPGTVSGFTEAYTKNKALLTVHSAVALVFGVALTVLSYFVG